MTYIPNARTGENGYKDSDLKGERAAFLRGYDAAIEDILCLEHNLEVYAGDNLLIHYLSEYEDKAEDLFSCIKHWAEMERNQTAVALLDGQYCEESDAEDDKNDKEG